MIVGIRNESIEDKLKRHKKEAEDSIEAWKNELEFAQNKGNDAEYVRYQAYCEFMIKTWENTLKELEKLLLVS